MTEWCHAARDHKRQISPACILFRNAKQSEKIPVSGSSSFQTLRTQRFLSPKIGYPLQKLTQFHLQLFSNPADRQTNQQTILTN